MRSRRFLLVLLALTACTSYRPAPLNVAVTTEPRGADARVTCPNERVREGVTPVRFRIPHYSLPCTLVLSKSGFEEKRMKLTFDLIDQNRIGHEPPRPAPPPPTFQPGATPFSLLGHFITRWLDNLGEKAVERTSTMLVPDAKLHVELEPEVP